MTRKRAVGAKSQLEVRHVCLHLGTKLHRSSGGDLEKINSLVQKLREETKDKERLAVQNQTLKFRIAELQKEKYSLNQLNKKLTTELKKTRIEDQGVVILKKKDFNIFLNNYYGMSEELEQMSSLHSEMASNASMSKDLTDAYLHNALQAEEELRQHQIKYF